MSDNYYITTPIYYVNGKPHIGHAYTTIICDAIARFHRLMGQKVLYLTGTDEHGQKVQKSAELAGKKPLEFCDTMSDNFKQLLTKLNISNDDFIRTTEDRHKKIVLDFWQRLKANGDIYLGKYEGWYSVRDEAFYAEAELTEEGLAPSGSKVEWVEEESYFFALSKWQDKLIDFLEQNKDFVQPKARYNEVLSFVKSGLQDLSISRTSFDWGIKIPEEDGKHVMYVWLDALVNYVSALGQIDSVGYKEFWPANAHVVGKDILRFHTIYWPAFLMAAGLPLPKKVYAHGWWTNQGKKMSKSTGNVIAPEELIAKYGLDQTRYCLMREIILGNDGNYVPENFINRINSELANKIGNLVQRSCSMVSKNLSGTTVKRDEIALAALYDSEPLSKILGYHQANIEYIKNFEINSIMDNIIRLAEDGNIYIDEMAPWSLKKTNPETMEEVLFICLEVVRNIALMLQPFVPQSAAKILDQLGIDAKKRSFVDIGIDGKVQQYNINQPEAIFPRINN